MTQKANLFKGQQKKKSVPPNRHGKPSVTRKGNYLALRVCVFVYGKVRYLTVCLFVFFFFYGLCREEICEAGQSYQGDGC